jgi:hypothetical protein
LTPSVAASSNFFAGLTSANQNSKKVNEHLTASAMAKDSWVNPELLAVGAMSSIQQVVQGWRTLRSK